MNDVKVRDLKRFYDDEFVPSQEYLDSMPDLQNSDFEGKPINFVGCSGFKIPIRIREKNGDTQEVCATFIGTTSVDAHTAGQNMSRIIRSAYSKKDDVFDINKLEEILRQYQKDQHAFDAHILVNFDYRIWQNSLRSVDDEGNSNGGWQYYNVTFDCNLDVTGEFKKIMWVLYKYSSTCPCSTELSFYNMETRQHYGAPHSQRSIAKIGVEFDELVWIEDVVEACKKAVATEVQIHVRRIDEMSFSEMCGTPAGTGKGGTVFVEDSARLFATQLNKMDHVSSWKCIILHAESLHPSDAVAVITKGNEGSIFNHHVTYGEWVELAQRVMNY